MPRRHDADAGGPAELLAAKAGLRDRVWSAMAVKGIARFPAPTNRIPNFVGAEAAARALGPHGGLRRDGTGRSGRDGCVAVGEDGARLGEGGGLPALDWRELTDEKIAAIPLLGRLRESAPL